MSPNTTVSDHRVTTHDIALPPRPVSLEQDREWCVVDVRGRWKKIRFHDYDEIYSIPGLYETLFYDVLRCCSPRKITELLLRSLREDRVAPGDLRVLDLGAGNGMVGERLAQSGVRRLIGVDIIPAAAAAARRDRQGVYDDYFVLDMAEIPDRDRLALGSLDLNCLTCVAALGFGDIPPAAFANAYNLLIQGGWIAFNIKTDFLESNETGGFASLIRRLIGEELVLVRQREQYAHRLATSGEPLHYTAFVAIKQRDIPAAWTF
jgi:SAM-dependent methyltransferase